MKVRSRWFLVSILAAVALTAIVLAGPASSGPAPGSAVLGRQINMELGKVKAHKWEQHVSSGVMYALLTANGFFEKRAAGAGKGSGEATLGCSNKFSNGNIRVNQDCSLRRQAEEVVTVNPTNTKNLVAGQNDSSLGFNHCGYDFSFDQGKSWGSLIPPFYQFFLLDGHTADACSDPTATWDADGNAYIGGILFDVGPSAANAIVVEKSNAPIGGAFYHTPNNLLSFQTYRANPPGVIATDNNPDIFNDKELMVADAGAGSPKKNNVYMTWTRFNGSTGAGVGANSPIYFSQSTTGGRTWSAGVEISGSNATYCTAFSGESGANACDQDQGSHPIVGSDGTIYVAFGNGNTPTPGLNQHMVVKCPSGSDCSLSTSWLGPYKISDDFGYQPTETGPTDPTTGCPSGRQCLPTNGYRLDDFVEGSISIDSSGKLYAVWADGRNIAANCHPNGAYAGAVPPCDNDVFYEYSLNGGVTWSATKKLTPAGSAQWQPWSAVSSDGKSLFVAYYDRQYGGCESSGCNDITMATVKSPATASPSVSYQRITSSSMPNLVVANNPLQAGFLGDYIWVAASTGKDDDSSDNESKAKAYVAWADTRGQGGAVEEDVYVAKAS
jgi:hypothetical protein